MSVTTIGGVLLFQEYIREPGPICHQGQRSARPTMRRAITPAVPLSVEQAGKLPAKRAEHPGFGEVDGIARDA
jgi:hypothetical protein